MDVRTVKTRPRNDWFDNESLDFKQRRKRKEQRWLKSSTDEHKLQYHAAKIEYSAICDKRKHRVSVKNQNLWQ